MIARLIFYLMIGNTSLEDDGTEYLCTADNAPDNFISIAVLNVTGGTLHM